VRMILCFATGVPSPSSEVHVEATANVGPLSTVPQWWQPPRPPRCVDMLCLSFSYYLLMPKARAATQPLARAPVALVSLRVLLPASAGG
jgi:hypothetical protein